MFTTTHLPTDYISTVEQAIENYGVESMESEDSTCTEETDTNEFCKALSYEDDFFIYDEVIATDKTSVSSSDWGDVACEYDLQESDRVRLMFSAMFGMLFSEASSPAPPPHLATEAAEWMTCFPHLRLSGCQLMPPCDQGFSQHAVHGEATAQEIPRKASESKGISVLGVKLEPNTPPLSARDAISSESVDCSETEETLASEGVFEEAIAVDYRLGDDEAAVVRRRHRRRGLPPLTPSAAVRDSVLNAMFDSLWSSWLPTIRPVLSRILRGPHDHDLELPQIGDTDPTGLAVEPRNSSSLARLPKVEMAGAPDVLSSLLHITSKTLQFRERSNLQDIPEAPSMDRRRSTDRNAFPPPSSRPPGAAEVNRVPSAARRSRAHLAPIGGLGLRGRRLQGPLGGPVEPLARSGTLPPLPVLFKAPHRVSSAAGGAHTGIGETRPSTTHTFHTPLDRGAGQSLLINGYGFGNGHVAAVTEEEEKTRVPLGAVYNSSMFPMHQVRKKSNVFNIVK